MAKKPIHYFLVDAFTDSPFRGNPAAVCLLDHEMDEKWMQSVAAEFNVSETSFLTRIANSDSPVNQDSTCRFRLRWFTPVTEVNICGHATLAAAHVLFTSGLLNTNVVEFATLSGILTCKKVPKNNITGAKKFQNREAEHGFFTEMDFPSDPATEFNSADIPQISAALNGASIIDIKRTIHDDNLLVVLESGKAVAEVQPNIDAIAECPGQGILLSGVAPLESGFDYYARFFFPKSGINEDPITGGAQCSLAPYWSERLGKCDLSAYAASSRGGVVRIHVDEQKKRILMRGKAVIVMEGRLLV